jgi:YebC/PmpR family DNA-binding regulatory protein
MSGHSKWSKVKHQKATTDAVKAKAFTKASKAITIAVGEGGGITDPAGNFKLRLAIEKAKEVNMPKENIERAIAKGKGEGGEQIELLLYEAYGPSGTAFLIEAATENKNRTVSAVKNILDHHGGTLAQQGSVLYQFQHIAVLLLPKAQPLSTEEIFTVAADSGATDVQWYDNSIEIVTDIPSLEKVKMTLEQKGIAIETTEILYQSTLGLSVSEDIEQQVEQLSSLLTDVEDVLRVYTNIK